MELDQKATTAWREAPKARAVRLLQEAIRSGTLARGSILPPERQLASQMQVGLATLQRAIRVVEKEGLVVVHGSRLRMISSAQPTSLLSKTIVVLASPDALRQTTSLMEQSTRPSGYLRDIAAGALAAVQVAGYHTMVLHPDSLDHEHCTHLLSQRPLGVIIPEMHHARTTFPEFTAACEQAKVPLVVSGDHPDVRKYDRVVSDHEAGEYEVTRWLIGRGRRHILPVFPAGELHWVERRHAGYRRAMAEAGLEPLPLLKDEMPVAGFPDEQVRFRVHAQYIYGCLAPLLKSTRPIDAVVATNDRHAFELGAACQLLGCLEGDRVLIAGYDNFYQHAAAWERELCPAVPAATVDKKNHEIGAELARLLLDRIAGRLASEPCVVTVPPLFIPLR